MISLLPVAYLGIRSAENGWEAWADALDSTTLRLAWNTVRLAVTVTALSAVLSLPLAYLTTRTDLPGRRAWSVVAVLPLVIPSYVGAFALVSMIGPRGLVQGWLEPFGVERLPDIRGFWGATLALTLFSYPYMLLVLRAAIRGLDPGLEEVARGLGRTPINILLTVILPQLRPALLAGSLLVSLYTLSDFGAVSILQYNTLTRAIFLKYQASFDRTSAAIYGLVLMGMAGVVVTLEAAVHGRARYYRTAIGAARAGRLLRLGRWRYPALGYCTAVMVVALLGPLGTLVYWLVEGLSNGQALDGVATEARNSVVAAGLASAATLVLALPVAILAARYRGVLSTAIERAAYAGHALPGLVVALALVFFGARYLTSLYQTIWLLTLAYVILFLPLAIGSIRASILQVSPNLELAARGLGRSPLGTTLAVTVPLVRPGVAAGAALVFLTTMKELPATLLLSPTGFSTLATSIWGSATEAFFARAALPALILVLISSGILAVLLHQERTHGGP